MYVVHVTSMPGTINSGFLLLTQKKGVGKLKKKKSLPKTRVSFSVTTLRQP